MIRILTAWLALLSLLPQVAFAQAQEDGGQASEVAEGTELDGGLDAADAVPQVDLSTPRSAVRSFGLSMQRAADDRPDLIDDAVRCLDLDWLEGDESAEDRARQLAAQLFELLGSLNIAVEDVPAASKSRSLELWSDDTLSVALVRSDGQWRFSRETLEQLDAIAAAVERAREEKEDDGDLHVHSELRSPRATMKAFLEAMDGEPPDLDRAADCLEPPEGVGSEWVVLRRDAAYRLYSVLLRLRAPVLLNIPEPPRGQRYTWYVHGKGRIVLKRMGDDDPETGVWEGEWRFSRSTLASLEDLYAEQAPNPILPEAKELGYTEHLSLGLKIERAVPRAFRSEALGLAIWKWLGVLCLMALAVVVFGLTTLGARRFYARVRRFWRIETETENIERVSRALGWLAMLYVAYRLIAANALLLPDKPLAFIYPAFRTLVLVALAVVGLRVVQTAEYHAKRSTRAAPLRVAGLLLPLLESFFRLLVGAILIAFVLRLLGFSQAAVLGGLGLLGAAVGLAAQGSIANIVAAISIVYDRPFRVGDWVNLDGVDATVERLGLVSIRLRTFYNSLLVVPNSQIVAKSVDNYGERRYRRLRHFLRLRYDTPAAKIDALCEGLRELVRLHPYTRKDYYHVYLNELTPSSADVMIYIFFDVPDWATELRERHRYLIDALALVEELGIELAYPTQRLLVEDVAGAADGEEAGAALGGTPNQEGIRRAKKLFSATYGDPPKERGPVVMGSSPLTAGFDDDGGDEGDGD